MSNDPHGPQGTPNPPSEGPSFQSPQYGQGQPPGPGYPQQGQYPADGQGQGNYPGQGGYGQPPQGGPGQGGYPPQGPGSYGQPGPGAYGQQPPAGYGQQPGAYGQGPGGYGPQGPGGYGPQGPGGYGPYDQPPQEPEKRNILPFVAIGSIILVAILGVVAYMIFGGDEAAEPDPRPTDEVTQGPETPPGGEETPGGEEIPAETPGGEDPPVETPGGEETPVETPGSEETPIETPGGETPGGEEPGGASDLPALPEEVGGFVLETTVGDTAAYFNEEFEYTSVTTMDYLSKEDMAGSLESPQEIGAFICGDAGTIMCVGEAYDLTVIVSGSMEDPAAVAAWGEEFLAAWQ